MRYWHKPHGARLMKVCNLTLAQPERFQDGLGVLSWVWRRTPRVDPSAVDVERGGDSLELPSGRVVNCCKRPILSKLRVGADLCERLHRGMDAARLAQPTKPLGQGHCCKHGLQCRDNLVSPPCPASDGAVRVIGVAPLVESCGFTESWPVPGATEVQYHQHTLPKNDWSGTHWMR
jgi:hypothetical protein